MRWYWEFSHYRKETGDLILDRVLNVSAPSRHVPDDFGVALTGQNIDAHIVRSRAQISAWIEANPELAAQIAAAPDKGGRRFNRQAEATCW